MQLMSPHEPLLVKIRTPYHRVCLTLNDVTHELDAEQLARLNDWLAQTIEDVDKKHREAGRGEIAEMFKSRGEVYAGASGGNVTFAITPTSVGTVFKVHESIIGYAIDVSNYDNW